ncbi:hypothetical protein B9Z55_007910 [Caenorhabditis nigoni]|uniref:Uncharacterized protein n=1 Tax=Caenorhabditis nigoni TaxID=1611254 RepID=A0A2G5VC35_9PELO|nr:hypothetical protein B9Z55_007910 [Caenorhabditis nigoni]
MKLNGEKKNGRKKRGILATQNVHEEAQVWFETIRVPYGRYVFRSSVRIVFVVWRFLGGDFLVGSERKILFLEI